MSLNLKLNVAKSLSAFAQNKVLDELQRDGRVLPATVVQRNGNMIEVSLTVTSDFTLPKITLPLMGPEYVRYPMQAGDKGIAIPMGTYLGAVSGQGAGSTTLTKPLNLSAMVFLPISNTEWATVDPNVLVMYGPEGVTLRDSGSKCTFMLTPTSIAIVTPEEFSVACGDTKLTLTTSGWTLSGTNGAMTDSAGTTSPKVMQAAWEALTTWANTHTHSSNGTGAPNSQLTTEIVS